MQVVGRTKQENRLSTSGGHRPDPLALVARRVLVVLDVVDDRAAVGRPSRMLDHVLPRCQPAYVGTVGGCHVDGPGVVRVVSVPDEHDLRSIR